MFPIDDKSKLNISGFLRIFLVVDFKASRVLSLLRMMIPCVKICNYSKNTNKLVNGLSTVISLNNSSYLRVIVNRTEAILKISSSS